MPEKRRGFSYWVDPDQIDHYRTWPIERRLKWLFYGNKLRKSMPSSNVATQEAFRKGKI